MLNRSFYSIFVLFTIFVFIVVPGVKMMDAEGFSSSSVSISSADSSADSYDTEINKGELGIRMNVDSKLSPRMQVLIYYDTETKSATDFFQQQLNVTTYQGFSGCNVIDWTFKPCGTSKLNSGVLTCPMGPEQCKFDAIHACVASLYKADQAKVGQFVICFFTSEKNVDTCVASIKGFVKTDIDQCVTSKQGDTKCDEFFTAIHGAGTHEVLGGPTGDATTDATVDFDGVLCNQLAQAKLTCNFCPPPATPSG